MASVRPIVCEWDAASTKPGPSQNTKAWRDLLPQVKGLRKPYVLNRRLGELIPTALMSCVNSVVSKGEKPLLLGGDHRLTYSVLKPLVHKHPNIDVHHWDAHHDFHESATLNNYSVFYFIHKDFGVNIIQYGVREEGAPKNIAGGRRGSHVYLSIDIDYIDPDIFKSVSYPLAARKGEDAGLEKLLREIKKVQNNRTVVGCDLVEWCGNKATQGEMDIVLRVLQLLVDGMSA